MDPQEVGSQASPALMILKANKFPCCRYLKRKSLFFMNTLFRPEKCTRSRKFAKVCPPQFPLSSNGSTPGFFFLFKNVWRPERLLPCTSQSEVHDTWIFRGEILGIHYLLFLLSGYDYFAMKNICVCVFWRSSKVEASKCEYGFVYNLKKLSLCKLDNMHKFNNENISTLHHL
jgi:hypothetical protein